MKKKLEISVLNLANLTIGDKKIMSEEEFKGRNEVADNFMKYFNIKVK